MKRYFLTTTRPGTTDHHCSSAWEYLNLPDGKSFVVVMFEEHGNADPAWTELPHLLDQTPLDANAHAAFKGFGGVAPGDQTFHMARKLGAIHPRFHP